jgi:ribosomal protein S18 acetylase RimI-like enzyme
MKSINLAKLKDAKAAFAILDQNRKALALRGIFQWTEHYPKPSTIEDDIRKSEGFVYQDGEAVLAYMQVSRRQDPEYAAINWRLETKSVLTVHRLAVAKKEQGKGIASAMMDFAEQSAQALGIAAIRLDAYSKNEIALNFYKKRGYYVCGKTYFPHREHHFYCFEKPMNK